jgi:hypothetical protein
MSLILLGVIEQALRLVNNLLEARPPEQRQAEALVWFRMWWPVTKRFLPHDAAVDVENIMGIAKAKD